MSKFKVGQEVVCIAKNPCWVSLISGENMNQKAPKYNEVYKVTQIAKASNGCEYITLAGFAQNDWWNVDEFEPVVDIRELKEILEQEPIAV